VPERTLEDLANGYHRPYFHEVPDRHTDAQIAELHLECFSSPAGRAVLDRWYVAYVLAVPPEGELGQRHIGKQDMFREIIDMMQRGLAVRRARARGDHGRE
jgi:hypothetical protein